MDNNQTVLKQIKYEIEKIEQTINNLQTIDFQILNNIENQIKKIKQDINKTFKTFQNTEELFSIVERVSNLNKMIEFKIQHNETELFHLYEQQIRNRERQRNEIISDEPFINEWLTYARNRVCLNDPRSEEPYKFVSYFIIFNFLYNQVELSTPKERKQIKEYIKFLIGKNYNPFNCIVFSSLNEESEYLKDFVRSKKYSDLNDYDERSRELENIRRRNKKGILALFNAIYIVRCNLFHGSKSLMNDRDYNLIKDGSKILEHLIEFVIENNCMKYKKHTR